MGTTMAGTISKTRPVSFTLVKNISRIPPNRIKTFRRATETDDPISDRISVVSVVRRLTTSPVMIRSKNAGLRPTTRSNRARRMSATTRSPRRVTR